MAKWQDAYWTATETAMLPRRDRRSGPFQAYIPDRLSDRAVRVDPDIAELAAAGERAIRSLGTGPGSTSLESLSRFLLRSEAIASSLIEGIAPSPQQVALAELAQDESIRGFSEQARLVANNITVLREAAGRMASIDHVSVAHVETLHRALLPDERHHGLRQVQNWIGGSSHHPLDAAFVPPPPDRVTALVQDVVDYTNGSAHGPLIQAALVHAQFETIHPFTDGNGRVGRALIHTVLTRRGLTPASVLPVSLVLATLSQAYVGGLTSYRYDGSPDTEDAHRAVNAWLRVFLEAAVLAAEQARQISADVADLAEDWTGRVHAHRVSRGLRGAPRADSATSRLLLLLPEAPVLTVRTVHRILGVSDVAARTALDELADARVLVRKNVGPGITGYSATEVFSLLGHAERALASTQFDTRASAPPRPAPAHPQG